MGTGAAEIGFNGLFEIVPIPEPGTWLAGALAFIALFATQRRRLSRIMEAEIRSRNLPDNL
jgi:MYXO-CTERM domain-containing protein